MKQVQVGVGIIVKKDNQFVLVHKRKNAHGGGTWGFAGGKLEYGESIETCAQRETFEETGLDITNIQIVGVTNDVFEKEEKHYLTIFVTADYISGEPQTKEPDKCEGWEWIGWDNLPRPLFLPIENLLTQGYNPFKQ